MANGKSKPANEIREYLEDLITHERECEAENCLVCERAERIYAIVRRLLFDSLPFPHRIKSPRKAKK